VDKYGLDAVRYFLLTQGPIGAVDANFSESRLQDVYTTDLVNTLGTATVHPTLWTLALVFLLARRQLGARIAWRPSAAGIVSASRVVISCCRRSERAHAPEAWARLCRGAKVSCVYGSCC
jgi:hypothetical protein